MLSSYMSTGTGTGTTSRVGPGVPKEKRRVKGCLKKQISIFWILGVYSYSLTTYIKITQEVIKTITTIAVGSSGHV